MFTRIVVRANGTAPKVPMVELSIKVSYAFQLKTLYDTVDKLGLNWLNWLNWLREADMTPSMVEVIIRG